VRRRPPRGRTPADHLGHFDAERTPSPATWADIRIEPRDVVDHLGTLDAGRAEGRYVGERQSTTWASSMQKAHRRPLRGRAPIRVPRTLCGSPASARTPGRLPRENPRTYWSSAHFGQNSSRNPCTCAHTKVSSAHHVQKPCSCAHTKAGSAREYSHAGRLQSARRAPAIILMKEKRDPERSLCKCDGGDEGIRTLGPHVANVMLSQLSYIPIVWSAALATRVGIVAHFARCAPINLRYCRQHMNSQTAHEFWVGPAP
jgi:hypothetical protein